MGNENQESVFDFKAIYSSLSIILANWRKLTIFISSVAVVTAVILLIVPSYYIAQVTILPPPGKSSLSGLMNLASELGYSSSGEAIVNSPQVISRIVRSRILSDMLSKREYFHGGKNRFIKLEEVYNIKEKDPERRDFYVFQALNSSINTSIDVKIKSLDIFLTANDSRLAADLLNAIVEELDNYNKLYRNYKTKMNREFIEKRLEETRATLTKSEEDLRIFRETNRRVNESPLLMLRMQRLLRNVNINQELFMILTKEYETAKLQEVRDTPVLDIIERARPLPVKSGPLRKKALLLTILFAMAIGISAILVREYIVSSGALDNLRQMEGYKIISRDLAAIFKRFKR